MNLGKKVAIFGGAATAAAHATAPDAHGGAIANVKLYGAKGDGATDDTAAFLAAVSSSKRILVPSGTYVLSQPIPLTTGQSVVGFGRDASILSLASGVAGITVTGANSRVSVRGLTITYLLRNGGLKETNAASIAVSIVHDDNANESPRELLFEELYIRGAYRGIVLAKRTFMVSVRQVQVVSCKDRAFFIDSASGGAPTTISLTNFYANDTGGIYFNGVSKLSLNACSVDSSTVSGLSGSTLIHFQSCTGTIEGLGFESNTHASANAGLVQFDGCRMAVACLESWNNTVTLSTGETYLIRVASNSVVSFLSGVVGSARNDTRSGAGTFFTVLAVGGGVVINSGFSYTALGGSGGTSAADSSGFADGYVWLSEAARFTSVRWGKSVAKELYGTGSPENAVAGGIGSTYRRLDGGAGTTFYVKESGTGTSGWVAK